MNIVRRKDCVRGGVTSLIPCVCVSVCLCMLCCSVVSESAILWTTARQTLSMEFCRRECWRGLSFPSPGDLLNPGIKSVYLTSPALAGGFFTTSTFFSSFVLEGF